MLTVPRFRNEVYRYPRIQHHTSVYSNEPYILELLVSGGAITSEQINEIRSETAPRGSVIETIIQNNYLPEEYIAQVCANGAGLEYIDLANTQIDPRLISLFTADIARRYNAVPLQDDGFSLTCAIIDPFFYEALDSLPQITGRDINFVVAAPSALTRVLDEYYPVHEEKTADKSDEDKDAPIIRLVHQMLSDAFKMRASDIHIEPMEDRLRIRYRVDGRLIEVATHPKKLLSAIVARIKVMSSTMSIAEKRFPQDGRIQMSIDGKQIDLRVSSVPSNHGESIVMRILDKSSLVLGLPQLGFFSDDEQTFDQLITLPDGIILVTGPTGSGKTTTLYACLNHINRPDKKIITVEDPVEYELEGINQVMVKPEVGMTFSAALRAMLRQAPNIIMIGEIRDAETANIAINAALTGHLVLSTLHTNDAPGAVARLANMGVKRFLIASAVRAVLAQRLVRRLCPNCKQPGELTAKQAQALNIDLSRILPGQVQRPVGCPACRGNGTKGRMGLFEIFKIDDHVRYMINEQMTTPQLRKRARELGMRTLREDGVRKLLSGLCSADEVMHVTMGDAN